VYARTVKDRTITLGVSGMLWENSLVMYDTETESLWSHFVGQAMRGPLEGEQLETIPSLMTDWESWKSRHPDTTVLSMERTSQNYRRDMFDLNSGLDIGLAANGKAQSWSFAKLHDEPVVNGRFDGVAIVVVYDPASHTAAIYDRSVDGSELTFESRDGELIDRDTDSRWDLFTGVAIAGSHKGKQLKRMPGLVTDSAAWGVYYPETNG
jgi:hypothetical protein